MATKKTKKNKKTVLKQQKNMVQKTCFFISSQPPSVFLTTQKV